jgi:hypothetical protein
MKLTARVDRKDTDVLMPSGPVLVRKGLDGPTVGIATLRRDADGHTYAEMDIEADEDITSAVYRGSLQEVSIGFKR